jgi:hypothetical protein
VRWQEEDRCIAAIQLRIETTMKQKVMALSGAEFLRRFSMHILPDRFVRIRHYGLLSATHRPLLRELQHAFGLHPVLQREKKHWKGVCREHLGFDPDICPVCGQGLMVVIQYLDPARGPPIDPNADLIPFSQKLQS